MEADDKILRNVGEAMNKMNDEEKQKFAAFTAGMAYMARNREPEAEKSAG